MQKNIPNNTFYGYARCSTNESKQDISRQIRELQEAGVPPTHIYLEYVSGVQEEKEKLTQLLSIMKEGDTLCVTEISRISRSTKQLCEFIAFVEKRNLRLQVLNSITIDCRAGEADAMTKAFLEISSVFAELERNLTRSRVVSGLKNAKANGKQLGRKPTEFSTLPDNFLRYYALYRAHKLTVTELARLAQISRPTTYKYLRIIENHRGSERANS